MIRYEEFNNSLILGSLCRNYELTRTFITMVQTPLDLAKAMEKSESLIVLQIYQFEQQQTEQTRPSSAQSGNMSSSTIYHSPSLPGSTSSPASFADPTGFPTSSSEVFSMAVNTAAQSAALSAASAVNGSLPPLLRDAPSSLSTSSLPNSIASATLTLSRSTTPISSSSPLSKDSKPALVSRNSTGNFAKSAAAASVGATPGRFSVADARSLAASNNPWAEEIEAAKTKLTKVAQDLAQDLESVSINEEQES